MKHSKIVGLCLVVAFAFMAVAAVSSASAAENGFCIAKKKGKYADAGCTTLAAKKGAFEWAPAGTCFAMKKGKYADSGCTTLDEKKGKPKGSFEKAGLPTFTSSTGTATLNTPGLGSVTCTASTGSGAVTGVKTGTAQTIFTGCETKTKPCENNPVGTQGEIATFPLSTLLVEPGLGGTVETTFEATGGGFSSEFFCNAIGTFLRTKGLTGGVDKPLNVMGTSSTTEFTSSTDQALKTEVMCAAGEWSGEASSAAACAAVGLPAGPGGPPTGGEFASEELTTGSATSTPAYEVRG